MQGGKKFISQIYLLPNFIFIFLNKFNLSLKVLGVSIFLKDHKIYKRLVNGLRPFATQEGLSDAHVINEWILYETGIDEENASICVCGKEGLRYNDHLTQACTTYGPQKLLIRPIKPQILFILHISLIKTLFECVKTYQIRPLDMSKKCLGLS